MKRLLQLAVLAIVLVEPWGLIASTYVRAEETGNAKDVEANATRAKQILKSMSDYMSGQTNISARFDVDLEAITPDLEKIQFNSSGHMLLSRPDKFRAWRTSGYSDVELIFDGKTAILYGKHNKTFGQLEMSGSVDKLIDELQDKYRMVMPGSDLLVSKPYDELIAGVLEAKYIGRGVIDDVECEHLAFRNFDTDWQLWVELGDRPIPRKYVITTKTMAAGPQYTVRIRELKAGDVPAGDAFTFGRPEGVKQVAVDALTDMDELPPSATPHGRK